MKRLSFLLSAALVLAACGGESAEEGESTELEAETEEGLKDEAVDIDTASANSETIPAGTLVKAEGTVTPITGTEIGDEFVLVTEKDGEEVTYVVSNSSKVDLEQGQQITVYGSFDGLTDSDTPKITATIIE